MERFHTLLLLLCGFVLIHLSFSQTVPYWGHICTNNHCDRVPVNETNRDIAVGLNPCYLQCTEFGTLWPRPRTVLTWNNTLVSVRRADIRILSVVPIQHQPHWVQNMARFNRILDAKILSDELASGAHGISIRIVVESVSMDLNLDTNEAYEMELFQTDGEISVEIHAQTYFGARHGLESLSQLIVYDEFSNQLMTLSHVHIRDEPVYRHRGILLDTARRYYSVETIKRQIDVMAMSKLNVFHWHITDSQSFAMVLSSHPELSHRGAYSPRQVYYPSDIEEIVEFALLRGVRIIPEFDAPSHVAEGFQGTNLVTCMHAQPWQRYCAGPPCGQLDPTKDELYDYLHDIYADMYEMFDEPPVFHQGGDEVEIECWNSSAEVREWMTERGWPLTHYGYLQLWDYFQERALAIYRNISSSANEKTILWTSSLTEEDVVDDFLNPNDYIIQIWTTGSGPASHIPHLLEKGYDVIISNYDTLYLDCGFGSWVGTGNNWCSPYHPWHAIYDNDFRGMAGNRTSQVLGGEVCSWSEPTDQGTIDSRFWPRASAHAERLWADPDTNFRGAEQRILLHREFLALYGVDAESIQPEWCVRNQGGCPYI